MTLKSILLSVTGVGTVCGGAVASSYYLLRETKQPKNIREKLQKENLKLLNTNENETSDDETWKKLIKKHVATTNPVDTAKKIKGLELTTRDSAVPNADDIKKIKNKCATLLNKPITTGQEFNNDLQNAKDWCTGSSAFAK